MPAYKGTKELPKPSNKQNRLLFGAMQKERDAIREGRSQSDNIQRAERDDAKAMKKGGKVKKYAAGGVTKEMPTSKEMGSMNMAKGGKAKGKAFAATKFGAAMMKKGADAKGRAMPKFAKGGSIDGCAVKGKTKTSMVKMNRGGKSC